MPIPNRGLSGQPVLPYVDYRSYQGMDVFIDLTFLDHFGNLAVPVSLSYQVDDITNAVNVIPVTVVAVTGSTQTIQIAGALLQLTHNWQGSEIFQIVFKVVLPGSPTSTVYAVSILELLAIQTPNTLL
jgi:hypothetical protein